MSVGPKLSKIPFTTKNVIKSNNSQRGVNSTARIVVKGARGIIGMAIKSNGIEKNNNPGLRLANVKYIHIIVTIAGKRGSADKMKGAKYTANPAKYVLTLIFYASL